jgi:hypothetical protein
MDVLITFERDFMARDADRSVGMASPGLRLSQSERFDNYCRVNKGAATRTKSTSMIGVMLAAQ